MYFQLPNGRTIEISFHQWCELTDEDIEYLVAYGYGDILEDPFFGSAAFKGKQIIDDVELPPLDGVTPDEMLSDLDADLPPE